MPVLVFVHGAGSTHKAWSYQTAHFRNALAIDLPGHGNSAGDGKKEIVEYVEVVKNYCDEKNLKKIVLIGHSMGGAIAQKFALIYPEYLEALVLVGTGAKLRVHQDIFDAIRKDYSQAIEVIVNLAFSAKTDSRMKELSVIEMGKTRWQVTYGDFEACDKFDCMDQIERIKIPTLIICGSEDCLTPVEYSEYLKNKISNSELKVIEDAGHMVMLEKPKEFNETLEKFIEKLGR